MYKIYYDIKRTSANTDYLAIDDADTQVISMSVLGVLAYMTELSISTNQDIKDFYRWFIKSDKRYHYNSKLKRNNSPQSFLAGCINNLQFGAQRNFSLLQLTAIQDIVNTCVDIIDEINTVMPIELQSNRMFIKLWCQENTWTTGQ